MSEEMMEQDVFADEPVMEADVAEVVAEDASVEEAVVEVPVEEDESTVAISDADMDPVQKLRMELMTSPGDWYVLHLSLIHI